MNNFDYSTRIEAEINAEIFHSRIEDNIEYHKALSARLKGHIEKWYKSELETQLNAFRIQKGVLTQ